MHWLKGCCCFRSLRSATLGAGMFTLLTSLMQILVIVAVFAGLAEMAEDVGLFNAIKDPTIMYPDQQRNMAILYIALAGADMLVIIVSIVLLYGTESTHPRRSWFYPWLILIPAYIIYESAINIYYFVWAFMTRNGMKAPDTKFLFSEMADALAFILVPLIYWAVKTIVIILFWFIAIFHTIEVKKEYKATTVKTSLPVAIAPAEAYGQTCQACSGYAWRAQPMVLNQVKPAYGSGGGFQTAIYDRPYSVQRGNGFGPSGPYRVY